jgi:CAAX protease family protein
MSRNELMAAEPNREEFPLTPMSPPEGPLTGARAIFWNERELRAGWRLLIFTLIFIVFFLVETYLTLALHLPQIARTGITATSMLVQEVAEVLAAFAAAGIMAMLEGQSFGGYGLPRAGAFGARFWQGALWGFAMITAVVLLIRALGGFSFGELALQGPSVWGYAALWLVTMFFVGLFEEFLFRGYALFTVATGMGFWLSAVALSAGFGAMHLFNRGEDKIGALSVFVIGLFFCLTLRRTGNLWFAVGLHAAFDWGETFLYSVPDSGIVAPGHLLNSRFHGPVWLTGGTVGPEGSVMAFVVVALSAILFAWIYPSSAQNP